MNLIVIVILNNFTVYVILITIIELSLFYMSLHTAIKDYAVDCWGKGNEKNSKILFGI